MLGYYIELSIKEMRRHPVLALLISLQIAVGVATFISCAQLQVALARDPLPGSSEHLFQVQLDPRSAKFALDGIEPPPLLTYIDAKALIDKSWGQQQSMSVGGTIKIIPDQAGAVPFFVDARATTADFFTMFKVPVLKGNSWDKGADDSAANVALITQGLSNRLFRSSDGVGKTLRLGTEDYRVIGIIDDWAPQPRFYDLNHKNKYGSGEQIFLPFSSVHNIDDGTWGDVDCWATPDSSEHYSNQPCFWVNYWVRLPDADAQAAYREKLVAYSQQQKAAGRYGVPPNVRLRNLPAWLSFSHTVPAEVQLESWLSLGFLGVCLVNTMGLLLTKFSQMLPAIGMRRALGASKRSILLQLLTEALMYGVAGGILAMLATGLGINAVRWQGGYMNASEITLSALAIAFVASLLCGLATGLLPAWRCLRAPVHMQIKAW